jgi:hypothetical protein
MWIGVGSAGGIHEDSHERAIVSDNKKLFVQQNAVAAVL